MILYVIVSPSGSVAVTLVILTAVCSWKLPNEPAGVLAFGALSISIPLGNVDLDPLLVVSSTLYLPAASPLNTPTPVCTVISCSLTYVTELIGTVIEPILTPVGSLNLSPKISIVVSTSGSKMFGVILTILRPAPPDTAQSVPL